MIFNLFKIYPNHGLIFGISTQFFQDLKQKKLAQEQAIALCIVHCSIYRHAPLNIFIIIFHHHSSHHYFPSLHHHYSPSYAPSYALSKNSIKQIHQRKSIFALSFFPSRNSIKRNPFLHYHFFHQEIPSKEIHFCTTKFSIKTIHHMHYQKIPSQHHHSFPSIFFITTKGIICGGKIGATNYAQASACKKKLSYNH